MRSVLHKLLTSGLEPAMTKYNACQPEKKKEKGARVDGGAGKGLCCSRGTSENCNFFPLFPEQCKLLQPGRQWIPAFCGTPGNEQADILAKEGARRKYVCRVSFSQERTTIRSLTPQVPRDDNHLLTASSSDVLLIGFVPVPHKPDWAVTCTVKAVLNWAWTRCSWAALSVGNIQARGLVLNWCFGSWWAAVFKALGTHSDVRNVGSAGYGSKLLIGWTLSWRRRRNEKEGRL